ncbi:MAG: lipid-binding SYLF domain-containing protein [Steroidobacteraceae bacterium]
MFKTVQIPTALLALVLLSLPVAPASAQARQEAQVIVSTQVLEELRGRADQFIPDRLLERAYGIAVIPDVKKAAFILGGRLGRGVLVVRDANGRFSNPAFVTLSGASVGWQAGAQETDVVLVFTTRAGVEGIADGKLTLGADASVAAGPVGRTASAATDPTFSAEIYSDSRSRGLFAGVALDGTVLAINRDANNRYYGRRVAAADIFSGAVRKDSESIRRLLATIATSTLPGRASEGSPATTTAAPAPAPAPTPAPATTTPEAQSFPMEDTAPGQEPPQ